MANWSNPTLTSTYTDFLGELKNRDDDLAKQFDGTTSSNLATGTIRWNSTTNRWQKWSGSAWAELTGTYALTALTTTGNATIGGTLAVTGATTLAAATATTPATGDNSTAVATTAYVRAQAYAPLASPALTGTPTVPTAAADTNTTQAASTAFLLGQAGSTSPVMNGSVAVGSSLRYARQDHVHPVDTSRAPLASPTLTGTPAGPTAAVGTDTTQLATTAFVNAEIANDAPSKTGTGASGTWGINVSGNAATATTLQTVRTINGENFNGSANITVTANTPQTLTAGSFLTSGGTFNGSTARTFAVDATSANTPAKVVARDGSGNFSAGTITASLTGTASGNLVSGGALGTPSSGTLTNCTFPTLNQSTTGNAATATTATNCSRSVLAGNGITGGGALSADRTITLGTPGSLTGSTTNAVTASSHTHEVTVNLGVTGGTTAGPVITSSAGTSATIPSAGSSTSGVVTTGTQTFAGYKVFADKAALGPGPSTLYTTAQGAVALTAGVSNAGDVAIEMTAVSTATRHHISFSNPNAVVGSISTASSSTSYNTSSDYRLKENVTLLDGAIARLNQLPVHRFNFIADPGKEVDGFLAHEAAAVVPECVTGVKDEEDEDGNPIYQGIDQSKVVPLLTAALQEAIAMISALETRIAALEA